MINPCFRRDKIQNNAFFTQKWISLSTQAKIEIFMLFLYLKGGGGILFQKIG